MVVTFIGTCYLCAIDEWKSSSASFNLSWGIDDAVPCRCNIQTDGVQCVQWDQCLSDCNSVKLLVLNCEVDFCRFANGRTSIDSPYVYIRTLCLASLALLSTPTNSKHSSSVCLTVGWSVDSRPRR